MITDISFIDSFNRIAEKVFTNAKSKGFWENEENRNQAEMICLMHSELSEALDGIRNGNPPSDHIPEFSAIEEELADCIIRIMDMAYQGKYKVAQAILAKMEYNSTRPQKHGKLF